MKLSPRDRQITERMRPGVLCREGFLGRDRRTLSEILDADRSAVAGLDLTHERIAAELARALEAAMAGLGREVDLDERLRATWHEAMGRIPCPWGGCGTFPKGELELRDETSARRLVCTPLSIHLIAAHGFYQGRGSRYRLEPARLAELLGLTGGGQ